MVTWFKYVNKWIPWRPWPTLRSLSYKTPVLSAGWTWTSTVRRSAGFWRVVEPHSETLPGGVLRLVLPWRSLLETEHVRSVNQSRVPCESKTDRCSQFSLPHAWQKLILLSSAFSSWVYWLIPLYSVHTSYPITLIVSFSVAFTDEYISLYVFFFCVLFFIVLSINCYINC